MPTQTAYAVPVGSDLTAYDNPAMLMTSATRNTRDGASLVNPSARPSAVAHTASKTPEATRTIHAMRRLPSVKQRAVFAILVRLPSSGNHMKQ